MTDPRPAAGPTVRRGRGHVEAPMAGQTLMMSLAAGKYFAVSETAARIWELIAEPRTRAEIVDALLAEYEIDRATCAAETDAFLDMLIAEGLAEEAAG